jgi:hypothetical protein
VRIGAVVRKNLTVTRTYDYSRQYANWNPAMYDPAAPMRPYFNVPQRDSWQLRSGAEYVWHQSASRPFGSIPVRDGACRSRSLLPESDGDKRTGTGITAGGGVMGPLRCGRGVRQGSDPRQNGRVPATTFNGFSISQHEGEADSACCDRWSSRSAPGSESSHGADAAGSYRPR